MYEYLTSQMDADDGLIHMIGSKSDDSIEDGMQQNTQYKDFNDENNAVVMKAVEILNRDVEIISSEIVHKALAEQVPGRFHKFSETIYYDGCHNSTGIEKAINMLINKMPQDQTVTIV
jgi:folylpolyglutamate synthase/dihydropteroate synthase